MSQSEPLPHNSRPSLDESCENAMQLQVAGRLDRAEPIYRSILRLQPTHAAANYCIGMLLVQLRRPADGLPHLQAAVDANPEIADYWLGHLEALLLLGETSQATSVLALARRHGLAGEAADDLARRLASKLPQAAGKAAATASGNAAAAGKPTRASRRREALAIRRQESAVLALVQERRFLDALPLAREITVRVPEHH